MAPPHRTQQAAEAATVRVPSNARERDSCPCCCCSERTNERTAAAAAAAAATAAAAAAAAAASSTSPRGDGVGVERTQLFDASQTEDVDVAAQVAAVHPPLGPRVRLAHRLEHVDLRPRSCRGTAGSKAANRRTSTRMSAAAVPSPYQQQQQQQQPWRVDNFFRTAHDATQHDATRRPSRDEPLPSFW